VGIWRNKKMKILINILSFEIGIILTLISLILLGFIDNKIIPSLI
jgi:hypothetical protein